MTPKQRNCLLHFDDQRWYGADIHHFTIDRCVKKGWLECNPYFSDHLEAEKHGWHHNTLYRLTIEGHAALAADPGQGQRSR